MNDYRLTPTWQFSYGRDPNGLYIYLVQTIHTTWPPLTYSANKHFIRIDIGSGGLDWIWINNYSYGACDIDGLD